MIFSYPILKPPGFHRAYSSPLYSNQQYACVKDLCKFSIWDLREGAGLEMVLAPSLDLEAKIWNRKLPFPMVISQPNIWAILSAESISPVS